MVESQGEYGGNRMKWEDVRSHFPHQWVLLEAIDARSEGNHRIIQQMTVVNTYPDGEAVMRGYAELRRRVPGREFCFFHTDREELGIIEVFSMGLRPGP